MNRNRRSSTDTETLKRVFDLLKTSSTIRGDDRERRKWRQSVTALADNIRAAQEDISTQGVYKAELAGAIKRIKSDHTREIISESKQLKLTNQTKRDAELNRRLSIDPQRSTFDEDLKTINRKMADLEIDIEYNRNMLKIRLAEVAGVENDTW